MRNALSPTTTSVVYLPALRRKSRPCMTILPSLMGTAGRVSRTVLVNASRMITCAVSGNGTSLAMTYCKPSEYPADIVAGAIIPGDERIVRDSWIGQTNRRVRRERITSVPVLSTSAVSICIRRECSCNERIDHVPRPSRSRSGPEIAI